MGVDVGGFKNDNRIKLFTERPAVVREYTLSLMALFVSDIHGQNGIYV